MNNTVGEQLNFPFPNEEDLLEPSGLTCPIEEVDVLGRRFKISVLAPDEDIESDGSMDLQLQEIKYRLVKTPAYNKDTVLHEIIHAVEEMLDCGLTEHQVRVLATGLLYVLQQNPDLVSWLCENE